MKTLISKICSKCKTDKSLEAFHKNSSKRSGLRSECKSCSSQITAKYRGTRQGKAKTKEANTRYKRSEKGKDLAKRLSRRCVLRKHGLSEAEFMQMLEAQRGLCPICCKAFSSRPQVDHDHETGKVRELLCGPCNRLLGHCYDSLEILLGAVAYLENHKEKV